jgi:hypothetical protein
MLHNSRTSDISHYQKGCSLTCLSTKPVTRPSRLKSQMESLRAFKEHYLNIFGHRDLPQAPHQQIRNVIMRYNDTIIKFYNFPVRPKVPMRVPSEPFYY